MNIAVFVIKFPKLSETFVLDQITALIDRGHQVHIYATEVSNEKKIHEKVIRYNLMSNLTLLKKKPLSGISNYDIILCQFGVTGLTALKLKDIGLITGKIITIFHGFDISNYLVSKGEECYSELFDRGDYFITTSDFFKKKLLKLGCPKEKLSVIGLGVDLEKFEAKNTFDLHSPIKVLSIGRLVEKKGFEYGIKAVHNLISNGHQIEYTIIGNGKLKEELEELISLFGLSKNVFLLGEKSHEEIQKIIKEHDIYLQPSITAKDGDEESIPVTIKEAIATGLPVISTMHSGIPELIKNGTNGFLAKERNAKEISRHLEKLIKSKELRKKIVINALDNLEKNWDLKKLNEELCKTIEKINSIKITSPEKPVVLGGSFWGITTFFNPAKYKTKLSNYHSFRDGIKKQGLSLITVELAFGEENFELNKEDAEVLIQLKTTKENVLWQKERLLNVALEKLPSDCDKIVWLDCDIIFEDQNWVEKTAKLLEKYCVVQPFFECVKLNKNKKYSTINVNKIPFGTNEGEKRYSFAYSNSILKSYCGHPGFAIAIRRQILETCSFYDRMILGSADAFTMKSFYTLKENSNDLPLMPNKVKTHRQDWRNKINKLVAGSVFYTPGTVYHLWHGSFKDRNYNLRYHPLIHFNFDPEKDIKLENDCWAWANNKKEMHKEIAKYFTNRKED